MGNILGGDAAAASSASLATASQVTASSASAASKASAASQATRASNASFASKASDASRLLDASNASSASRASASSVSAANNNSHGPSNSSPATFQPTSVSLPTTTAAPLPQTSSSLSSGSAEPSTAGPGSEPTPSASPSLVIDDSPDATTDGTLPLSTTELQSYGATPAPSESGTIDLSATFFNPKPVTSSVQTTFVNPLTSSQTRQSWPIGASESSSSIVPLVGFTVTGVFFLFVVLFAVLAGRHRGRQLERRKSRRKEDTASDSIQLPTRRVYKYHHGDHDNISIGSEDYERASFVSSSFSDVSNVRSRTPSGSDPRSSVLNNIVGSPRSSLLLSSEPFEFQTGSVHPTASTASNPLASHTSAVAKPSSTEDGLQKRIVALEQQLVQEQSAFKFVQGQHERTVAHKDACLHVAQVERELQETDIAKLRAELAAKDAKLRELEQRMRAMEQHASAAPPAYSQTPTSASKRAEAEADEV